MTLSDWNGQNIANIHEEWDGSNFAMLPILECFLDYNEETIYELLPSANSYGWGDSLTNSFVWANNAYKVVYFIPDFTRYGCLPSWFPTTDNQDRELTGQGQADRFLYLLDLAFGGFPEDHHEVEPHSLVEAILELRDNIGEYVEVEEGDRMEWQLSSHKPESQPYYTTDLFGNPVVPVEKRKKPKRQQKKTS